MTMQMIDSAFLKKKKIDFGLILVRAGPGISIFFGLALVLLLDSDGEPRFKFGVKRVYL